MTILHRLVSKIKMAIKVVLSTRLIVDYDMRLGDFSASKVGYPVNLNKEEISRKYLLNTQSGNKKNFLDVGGSDGLLSYMLGIEGNLEHNPTMYEESNLLFKEKYSYYGMDLLPGEKSNVIVGDICDEEYIANHKKFINFFDVVYSNNVFEHLKKPWHAAKNISCMLKKSGLLLVIVPFSQRYHEVPGDYFRYTHTGLVSLFENYGKFEVLESGYDITGRRNNWQGSGKNNDIVPIDKYGAWRETWFTVVVLRKL